MLESECDEMSKRRALLGWGDLVLGAVLSAGANVWGEWLRVPLEHALMSGQTQLAKKLIEAGADCTAGYGSLGQRTLLCAAAFGAGGRAVEMMLDAGSAADVDLPEKDELGMTPLHFAALKSDHETIRLLCRRGASPEVRNSEGSTPLHMASVMGDEEATFELLKCRGQSGAATAGHDARNSEGSTPLHYASSSRAIRRDLTGWRRVKNPPFNHVAVISRLLMAGADKEAKNAGGYTPLRVAVTELFPDAVRALLRHGADETGTVKDGETMLESLGEARKFYSERLTSPEEVSVVQSLAHQIGTMLERAPADRAWQRRGWLVMLRRRAAKLLQVHTAVAAGASGTDQHREGGSDDNVRISVWHGGGDGPPPQRRQQLGGVSKRKHVGPPYEVVRDREPSDVAMLLLKEDVDGRDTATDAAGSTAVVEKRGAIRRRVVTRQSVLRAKARVEEERTGEGAGEKAAEANVNVLYDFGRWSATVCQEGIFRNVVSFL